MAIPLIPIITVVRILGPKAVRAAKSLHKRLVAQKKTKMSQEEFLSNKARIQQRVNKSDELKKKVDSGPKQPKEYKGKTNPMEKKAEPPSMNMKTVTKTKVKKEDVLVSVFNKATKKYKQYDVRNMSKQQLNDVPNASNKLISKWIQYHEKGGLSPKQMAAKLAAKKLKDK